MATIKEQTEKTEQLKTTLDSKVIAIASEIKKQDNIDITRLSEVPDAIAQLKNSRKRWASGKESKAETVRELNLDFKPSILIIYTYSFGRDSDGSAQSSVVHVYCENKEVRLRITGASNTNRKSCSVLEIENVKIDEENFKNYVGLIRVDSYNLKLWYAFE